MQATLSVTPGQVLQIRVGGAGIYTTSSSATSGGYNGGGAVQGLGGGGGGATDVRSSSGTLTDRLLVAGGGGGGGYIGIGSQGGAGGAPIGGNANYAGGGTGGTLTAGGNAGGGLGVGGASSGGGGGGYYGGGASASYDGGGGGSSWVTPTGSSSPTFTANYQNGNGSLTITPGPGYAAPALNGSNFVNVPGTWQVNGADVYRSTGNVGIGTASPVQKLDVIGNSYVSGQVGIGTTSPGYPLTVQADATGRVLGFNNSGGTDKYNFSLGSTGLNLSESNVAAGRLFVQNGGNVGIGTTNPNAKLHVAGVVLLNGGSPVPTTTNATGLGWNSAYVGSNESEFYNYRGAGNGGFRFFSVPGTAAPTASNQVAQISNTGSYSALSDRRVKTNIAPLAQGLRTVLALRPVSYDFHTSRQLENGVVTFLPDDKPVRALGFVAQELLPLVPEAVEKPADEKKGFYAVSYTTLVPVLTQAIQEQQAQIEALKKQNAALQARAATAEARTATLEAAAPQAAADHASLLTLQAQMARLLGEAPQASLTPRK